jgi:hypothetical protein
VFNDIKLLNSSSLNSTNPEASEYAKYLLWFLKIEKKGDVVRVGCMVYHLFFSCKPTANPPKNYFIISAYFYLLSISVFDMHILYFLSKK